jgi:hypothetical protein
MKRLALQRSVAALALVFAFVCQGTWALAGTTGGLSGTVTDEKGAPIAGATLRVASPSQTSSTVTDRAGHFQFLSLAPDTYSVSIEKDGYAPVSYAGVSVFADQIQTLAFHMESALKTIARVTSTAAGALVKAGTTSDVYSVNATTAAKVTGLGGGGGLDSAYSAIATMPGAYVPVGQMGWFQNVFIRGGDYDQVGYEVDGVPVNRAFDNYPSNTATALGQQEVQVYTGAAPSNAEGQGLSGFINQVIKTGTYPGYAQSDLAAGAPAFYHKANIEVGGSTPNRLFSYYAGFGGYDIDSRDLDQFNGADVSTNWGYPTGVACGKAADPSVIPSCFNGTTFEPNWDVLSPFIFYATPQMISDRENVVNFHFAIPHRHDAGRDDIQLLWQGSDLKTYPYGSQDDLVGSNQFANAVYGVPAGQIFTFPATGVYTGPLNQLVPASSATGASFNSVQPYCFPSAPSNLACGGNIPANFNDGIDNAVGIVKLQYQKNFSSNAYLRVYGYTVYSNWFEYGPNSASLCCTGIPTEYEVQTHTRGVSATFADQITPQNLLQLQGSYSQATSERFNNETMFPSIGAGTSTTMGVLVNGNNPNSGICYTTSSGTPTNCDGTNVPTGTTNSFTVGQLACAQNPSFGGRIGSPAFCNTQAAFPTVTATSCGGGPCEWDVVDTGYFGRYNTVEPRFWSSSLTDEWDPADRLHTNFGVRFDSFAYLPSDTLLGARPFWTNAWNNSYCTNPATPTVAPIPKVNPTLGCTDANLGVTRGAYVPATITDSSDAQQYMVWQPRFAATYTINPLNVLRFSWGKYDQAPNTAFEQYDSAQQNLPDQNANFYTLGFYAPTHPILPEESYNTDLSWEHQFKGTDVSFKVTPFYRRTNDQIQQFFLNVRTAFVSGLNIGQQTNKGVEFELQKGDFSHNGFSSLLSFTYTNAYVTYSPTSNGTTPVSGINAAIQQYNGFTKAGGGAPCYTLATATTSGSPSTACGPGTVANPYYNAPEQGLLDPGGRYAPYDLFPAAAPGAGGYVSFVTPYVSTLVLNYKHDKWAVTPALQFSAGERYGYPIAQNGIDPSSCSGVLGGSVIGDPRYPYGGSGSPFNATTCSGQVSIPDPYTGTFDGVGAYSEPNRITLATQLTYDVSPRISVVLTAANIVDRCWGGTKAAWTSVPGISSNNVCFWGQTGPEGSPGYAGVGFPPVGNIYNPPFSSVQPFQRYPYLAINNGTTTLPFNAYLDFKLKL